MAHQPREWRTASRVAVLGTVGALALAGVGGAAFAPLAIADDASAVSQATGRIVDTSLFGKDTTKLAAALKGASAVNTKGAPPVVADVPLDKEALDWLLGLKVGNVPLFGDDGNIRLGGVTQHAEARGDGSSSSFSGALSAVPAAFDARSMARFDVGTPNDGATASLAFGDEIVNFRIDIGKFAASAQRTAEGTQAGEFTLSDLTMVVGGSVVKKVVDEARGSAGTIAYNLNRVALGIVPNPFREDGTVLLTLDDLVAAAGVDAASVYDLTPGVDLLDYVPTAIINKLTAARDQVIKSWGDNQPKVCRLNWTVCTPPALTSVTKSMNSLDATIAALPSTIDAPLSADIPARGQLYVNVESTGDDGVFTQTAMRFGQGPDGSSATVDLASASVGPAPVFAVPLVNGGSAAVAGTSALLAGGVWLAVASTRRRRTRLVAV